MSKTSTPLRILACSVAHEHGNDYAFVRAFRRAGHSVQLLRPEIFAPPWQAELLRFAYRVLQRPLTREFNQEIIDQAENFKPDLFFVFKGHLIFPETIEHLKQLGIVCIQFYPDVSFYNHGPYIPKTITKYDWVFSTKPEHPADLAKQFGYQMSSFLPHAFNPEIHKPVALSARDQEQYECDVSFIGNYSKGKEEMLRYLIKACSNLYIKIWGGTSWRKASGDVAAKYQGTPVYGLEYAKAIQCSKINLGLLLETVQSAGRGDRITARTFEIPASGGFMLHQRSDTVLQYFEEGHEVAYFDDTEEMIVKIDFYLTHDHKRKKMIKAAHERCHMSSYSVDHHMERILKKYYETI